MKRKGFLLFSLFFLLTNCTMLVTERSFVDEMDKDTDGFFVAGKDFPVVPGDTGKAYRSKRQISERTPMNKRQEEDLKKSAALESELQSLEESLADKDYQLYLKNYHNLPTISEKIYFLKLNNIEEREQYLSAKGHYSDQQDSRYESKKVFEREFAVKGREIFVGMSKDAVIQSWGRPIRIDVAGNPSNENERWIFYSENGNRYVFFEGGSVQGWIVE